MPRGRLPTTSWATVVARADALGLDSLTEGSAVVAVKKTSITVRCRRCGVVSTTLARYIVTGDKGPCRCRRGVPSTKTWGDVAAAAAAVGVVPVVARNGPLFGCGVPIEVRCLACDRVYLSKPNNLLAGRGCRRCRQVKRRSSYTYGALRAAIASYDATLLEELPEDSCPVELVHRNIAVRCRCGETFRPKINALLADKWRSCGCVRSEPQTALAALLRSWGEEVVTDDATLLGGRQIDVLLPAQRLGIEYHGLRWHGEALHHRHRTLTAEKAAAAAALGYRLIVIFEDEWVYRRGAVENRLRAVLGRNTTRAGARSCTVEALAPAEAGTFTEAHHLQGARGGQSWGLRWRGELVAVATFARTNASRNSQGSWELMRFCVVPNHSVAGGLSRLIAAFRRTHPEATELVSYSDNRWSDGGLYRACGFTLEKPGRPSYWYFGKGSNQRRLHRYTLRKQVLLKRYGGDPSKTEWALAQEAGYDRVWDLGAARWVLKTA